MTTRKAPSRWLREPLLWFLAAGSLLFWLDRRDQSAAGTIVIDAPVISRLADQWEAQMGRAATDAELRGLMDDWLREEIYSREAAAMGLDSNDTIIRRRLVQKLRFLTEDVALAEAPTPAELAAFYAANEADYREPARYDFEHRYFSADRRADPAADAAAALTQILAASASTDEPAPVGDPFLLQRSFQARSVRQIGDLFGQGFADAFAALPVDRWSGPVGSAYGQHLIRVTQRLPSYQPPLADVQQRVLADLARNRRETANEAFYEELRARYRVIRAE